MKKHFPLALLSIAVLALVACGGSSSEAEVTGTIILPDGATVPAGATISVKVEDTSLADAPATVIGEQTIEGEGQESPIEFAVPYDPADIQDNHMYGMNVRIEDENGSLLFINDTHIPVITGGAPTEDVVVPVIEV